MISLLIIVGVGAITAWSVTRQRSRRPQPQLEQPAGDAMAELEKQLANSDLSEEEKAEIRKTFQQNQQPLGGQ